MHIVVDNPALRRYVHERLAGAVATARGKRLGPQVTWTGHRADAVRQAIAASMMKLPRRLRRSLTWDQGAEMSQHARLSTDTALRIYFCGVSLAVRGNAEPMRTPMGCCDSISRRGPTSLGMASKS